MSSSIPNFLAKKVRPADAKLNVVLLLGYENCLLEIRNFRPSAPKSVKKFKLSAKHGGFLWDRPPVLTYSPTHSPTHAHSHSLTHSLTQPLTHSHTHALTASLTYSLTYSITHLLAYAFWHVSLCKYMKNVKLVVVV